MFYDDVSEIEICDFMILGDIIPLRLFYETELCMFWIDEVAP
jgi:hypothetical protein